MNHHKAVCKGGKHRKMEDKDKKKNVKKLIVYAVLLALIMGIALGTGQIQTEELGRIFTVNAIAVCKLLLLIFGVLFLKSLIVWILVLIKPANHRARSVLSLLSSLTKYIAFLVILCAGLTILGVNMTTIIASVGVLALIVGFSAESLIADVVTGTFMLLENQYNVGDIVEVNGFRGTVTSIGIRTTCITDTGDNVKIINNSEMKNILNRSDNYSKAVCDISIPYETDLEKLESELPKLLESIYKAHEDTMKKVPVYVRGSAGIAGFRNIAPVRSGSLGEKYLFRHAYSESRSAAGLPEAGRGVPFPAAGCT